MADRWFRLDLKTRIFVIFVVAISAFSSTVLGIGIYIYGREYRDELVTREINRTQFANQLFFREIEGMRQNVMALSEMPPVEGIINASRNISGFDSLGNSGLEFWKLRLEQVFSAFIATRSYYFQLRLIGVADMGRELVRVDRIAGRAVTVPEQNLQLKGDRDYFREAIKMKQGQVYLSPINLNREYGRIEVPHRPTLRAAAPVFGPDGKVFGIFVANMDMSIALETFRRADLRVSAHTW